MRRPSLHRRALGLVVLLATVAPPVLVPVLDAGEPGRRAAYESEHEPGRCTFHHDHRACVHLANSSPHPEPGTQFLPPRSADRVRPTRDAIHRTVPFSGTHHRPRSPPTA